MEYKNCKLCKCQFVNKKRGVGRNIYCSLNCLHKSKIKPKIDIKCSFCGKINAVNAKKAKSLGLQTSIDINFSERIWPDREEAKQVLRDYLSTNPLVKLSEDDCYRLFAASKTEDYIFDYFHELGASTICLTKGKDGVVLSDKEFGMFHQQATRIDDIKDTTGAGDAFWTGFLYARLLGKGFEQTITIAQKLAVLKLQNVGRLPEGINIQEYLGAEN